MRQVRNNPGDQSEWQKMRRQCGWYEERVPAWLETSDRGGLRAYFFYTLTDTRQERPIGVCMLMLEQTDNGTIMACREEKRCELMSLFVYPEYRQNHYALEMSSTLVDIAFRQLDQQTVTVMHRADLPSTVRIFDQLGFVEFYREPKPHWANSGLIGVHRRLTRREYQERRSR
ncbi:hypothetical protein PYCC9005_001049 [Savitreella phatthalungensis]